MLRSCGKSSDGGSSSGHVAAVEAAELARAQQAAQEQAEPKRYHAPGVAQVEVADPGRSAGSR
jgi:hypothetical protein